MATETAAVPLDQSTEGCVEKKENETTENIKQEIVSQSKETGDEESVEMVQSRTEVAAVTQPEEKTQEDKIDLPVVVEKKVEEAVDKTPASDVSVDGEVEDSNVVPEKAAKLEKESEEPPKMHDIPESLNVEEKPKQQLEVSPLESEPEVSKESKVPESTAEVVPEPEEHLGTSDVVPPAPEAGIAVEQQPETSAVSKSVSEVKEKMDEQPEVSVVADIPEEVEKQVERILDIPDVAVQAAEAGNVAEEKLSEQPGESGVPGISEAEKAEEEGASDVAIPAPAAENAAKEQLDEPVSKTLPEDEESKELPVSAPNELISEATGEIENKSAALYSNQSVEAEGSKDERTHVEIESSKEEPTMVENASAASEEEKQKEDNGESAVPDIVEQVPTEPKEDTKKEESNVDVVERVLEEAAVKEVDKVNSVTETAKNSEETEDKIEEEKEEKIEKLESAPIETVCTEDVAPVRDVDKVDSVTGSTESLMKKEDKVEEVKVESDKIESAPAETNKTKDMGGSDSATLVDGVSSGEEMTSKDAGIIVDEEKKEEIVKEEIPTTVEASTDQNVRGTDVIDTKERGLEEQAEEQPIPSGGDEVEKAEEKTEAVEKSDVQNPVEPTNKDGDPKVDGGMTKQEAPAKQKQSNNLISKVKHSIGKVKKAIIGKSPSSKTLSSESKGDANVK